MTVGKAGAGVGVTVVIALVAGAAAQAAALRTEGLSILTASGRHHFRVEVANTEASRERGLMHRRWLASNRGMLFDFKTPQTVSFWMHDTVIPLDMVFVGADGHIVSIAHNAKPMSDRTIPSGGPVLTVVELRGGVAAQIDARPGDAVIEERPSW